RSLLEALKMIRRVCKHADVFVNVRPDWQVRTRIYRRTSGFADVTNPLEMSKRICGCAPGFSRVQPDFQTCKGICKPPRSFGNNQDGLQRTGGFAKVQPGFHTCNSICEPARRSASELTRLHACKRNCICPSASGSAQMHLHVSKHARE